MRRALLALVLLAGCGRVDFDPIGDGDGGTGGSGGSGSGAVCGGSDNSCFSNTVTLSAGSSGTSGSNLSNYTNNLQSICGGAGGADVGILFIALDAGTYEFTVNAQFDTVLYALGGQTCDGDLMSCQNTTGASGEKTSLTLTVGERVVIVVDSGSGCGDFTVSYRSL